MLVNTRMLDEDLKQTKKQNKKKSFKMQKEIFMLTFRLEYNRMAEQQFAADS